MIMIKRDRAKQLSCIPLLVAAVFAIAILSTQANRVSATEGGNSSKGNTTKLQARISLETKNLDIDENSQQQSDKKEGVSTPPTSNSTYDATTTVKPRRRNSANKERSNRRLNNIWSLFLPESSAGNENDYEDEATSATDNSTSAVPSATPVSDGGKLNNLTDGSAFSSSLLDENVFLDDEQSSTSNDFGESMLSSPSGANRTVHLSSNRLPSFSNQINDSAAINVRSDQQPVQLITGALSKDLSPKMNDIVSNIMSSMSSANESQSIRLPTDGTGLTSLLDGGDGEREDGNGAPAVVDQTGASNNSSDGGESSFERWLSRIQFQTTPTTMAPTSTSASRTAAPTSQHQVTQNKVAPAQLSASTISRTQNLTTGISMLQQLSEFNGIADGVRPKSGKQKSAGNSITRQLQHGSKSHPVAAALHGTKTVAQSNSYHHQKTTVDPHLGVKGGHLQQELQSNEHKFMVSSAKYGQQQRQQQHNNNNNPLLQQLRRQNSQLIHGIKFPSAQASTISVSTEDGASNTSLSFATQNFVPPTPMGLFNEMSQVVNSSNGSSNAVGNQQDAVGNSNETTATAMHQESVYQSQDEILRQVTSAINFERQLQNKVIQSGGDSHNHRQPGEAVSVSPNLNFTDIEATNSIANLFKAGANSNELINPTTTSSPTDQANNQKQQSSLSRGSDDIDKSFDFLARFVAQRQQQQASANNSNNGNSSNQPSWLRRPGDIVLGANSQLTAGGGAENIAARLAASLAASGAQKPGQQSISADQVLELLSKHEKSKNELKHSQESMALLMQQLMRANNSLSSSRQQSGNLPPVNKQPAVTSLIRDEQSVTDGGDNDHTNQQLRAGSGGGQQEAHSAVGQPPSNFGWTPVNRPAGSLHSLAQVALPPISPAKLVKTRVKAATGTMKISQANDDVGIGKDFVAGGLSGSKNADDYYMNNLALMFASSQAANNDNNINHIELTANDLQQPGGQRIFGLPIAVLKEDEIELHQAQLEAAAAAAAEQLSRAGKTGQIVRHHFPPPIQQQRQALQLNQAGQIAQIQKILENYSPQSFAHGLQPRAPISDPPQDGNNAAVMQTDKRQQSQPSQQQQRQHNHPLAPSLNNLASLIHHDQGQLQEQSPYMNLLLTTKGNNVDNFVGPAQATGAGLSQQDQHQSQNDGGASAHNQKPALQNQADQQQQQQRSQQSLRNQEISKQLQQNDEFRLLRQAQNRQQQQLIPGPGLVLTPSTYRVTSDLLPLRVDGAGDGFVHREPLITTTTITSGGPPVRVREVGLRRPFGFRSHHAIAYQPPPAVSAMFSSLSGHQTASRPSLLRHMTPFRAVASTLGDGSGGQRFLAPLHIVPGQEQQQQYEFASSEQLPFNSHQYRNYHPLFGTSFTTPMSVPMHQHYVSAAARASGQLERHSTIQSPEIGWRNARMASNERLGRLHHFDVTNAPLEIDQGDENLIEEDDSIGDLVGDIPDSVKYLALDQFKDHPAGIDVLIDRELNLSQRHHDSFEVNDRKSRPSREPGLQSPRRHLREQQSKYHHHHQRRQHHHLQPKQQLQQVAADTLMRIDQPSTKVTMKNPCPKTEVGIQSVAPTTTNAPLSNSTTTLATSNQFTTNDTSSWITISTATTTTKPSTDENTDTTTSLPSTNNNNNTSNVKPSPKIDDQPSSIQGDDKQISASNTNNATQFNVNATLMVI